MFFKYLKSPWVLPLLIVVLGLVRNFLWIAQPAEVVFDEVHFGKFLNAYLKGEYYFDIHPPLGKLLLALGGYGAGYQGDFSFERISQPYGSTPYVALRTLPNLAGGLLPLAVYLFLLTFGLSKRASALAAVFLLLENALLVQTHFILIDAFLLFFGFLGLAAFFWARQNGYEIVKLSLAGFLLALSFSVKWTGLAFFALAGFFFLKDLLGRFRSSRRQAAKLFGKSLIALVILPIFVYLSVFYIHFSLLPRPGPGDAYMSADFVAGKKNFWAKTFELNLVMYSANATLSATHPYSSKFYSWPIMARPVYYWVKNFPGGEAGRIYLLGNPILWWLATFGMIFSLFRWRPKEKELKLGLYLGYFLNILPFVVVPRVLFLYHYLAALIFSVAVLSALIADSEKAKPKVIFVLVALVFASFIFFAPLSYGLPLSEAAYRLRLWLPRWI